MLSLHADPASAAPFQFDPLQQAKVTARDEQHHQRMDVGVPDVCDFDVERANAHHRSSGRLADKGSAKVVVVIELPKADRQQGNQNTSRSMPLDIQWDAADKCRGYDRIVVE